MSSDSFIVLAKIGKPFGLKGFLNLQTYTDSPEQLLNYSPLYWKTREDWELCPLEDSHLKGAILRAKFQGCDTPEAAQVLTHRLIGVPREALPEPPSHQSYYWADLEGLTVINSSEVVLGKVKYLMNIGASDLMVVQNKKEELLIPFVMIDVVLEVDLKAKMIRVDWSGEFQ